MVPDSAIIHEKAVEPRSGHASLRGNDIFIVESKLKVLTEQDYFELASSFGKNVPISTNEKNPYDHVSFDLIKKMIIPLIEEEVNTGVHFASLRQIYHSVILASWYKQNLKETLLSKIYVDQNKLKGFEPERSIDIDKVYSRYIQSFKVQDQLTLKATLQSFL